MPEEDDFGSRRLRSRRLGWLVMLLAGATAVSFVSLWIPGVVIGLGLTALALIAWVFSGPWVNPFDPD